MQHVNRISNERLRYNNNYELMSTGKKKLSPDCSSSTIRFLVRVFFYKYCGIDK